MHRRRNLSRREDCSWPDDLREPGFWQVDVCFRKVQSLSLEKEFSGGQKQVPTPRQRHFAAAEFRQQMVFHRLVKYFVLLAAVLPKLRLLGKLAFLLDFQLAALSLRQVRGQRRSLR